MSHHPCGNGATPSMCLLITEGIPLYLHPITPFENMVIWCAAAWGEPSISIVRHMLQLQWSRPTPNSDILEVLWWMAIRLDTQRGRL